VTAPPLADQMRLAASELLGSLTDAQRLLAHARLEDDDARRWLEYRPRPRPGASLSDLDAAGRKAAYRLLATGLSPHAYAQALAVTALEEILDRREGWARGRHSNDYWVNVFGDPETDTAWSWRFEGHHVSVTMTIADGTVSPAPIFLGANPARITRGRWTVLAPMAAEEELALELLEAIGPRGRGIAVVSDVAPEDIRSGRERSVALPLEPVGIGAHQLAPRPRALLDELVALYVGRVPDRLAEQLTADLAGVDLHFAWEGTPDTSGGHYYRIQGPNLLIEYDNTDNDANHCHTVLRRPLGDFGYDVLAAHRRGAHG
jgi:Protein of unknown function (DUF3500)